MSGGDSGSGRAIGAALGGGGLFLALWLGLGLPLAWSAAAGGAGYGALWFMLKSLGKRQEAIPFAAPFVDKELARKTVAQGRAAARELREEAARIKGEAKLLPKFARLAELLDAIASDVEADPKDAVSAQAFIAIQGEAAARIARLAAGLAQRGASSAQLGEARVKIALVLDRLIASHEKQLANLQEDNLAELQAELDGLEQSLSLEEEIGEASRSLGAR